MGRFSFLLLLLHFSICAIAQNGDVNRYVVFFTDKQESPYSIDRPEEFLSLRSLARRGHNGVLATTEDLPVNPMYLDSLRSMGFKPYFPSRWLNAVIVQEQEVDLGAILQLSFVDSVGYLAKGDRITDQITPFQWPESFVPPNATNLTSDIQNSMLGISELHADGFKGEGMFIAVFDGGFLGLTDFEVFSHLFTDSLLVDYYDFVTNGKDIVNYDDHGTTVLTPISGIHDSIYTGIAPNAQIALFVTEDVSSEYMIEEYNWVIAAERADSLGVDVINSSVGYSTFSDDQMDYTYEDLDGKTSIASIAGQMASDRGIIVVSSAGNEGNKPWNYITTPADAEGVIAVGAVNGEFRIASFSSLGPTFDGRAKPDLCAKGSPTVALSKDGNFYNAIGSSYASPQVAALAAAYWQAKPALTNLQVIEELKSSGHRAANPDNQYGYGVPNYGRAITGQILSVSDIVEDRVKVYPNPFKDNRFFIALDNKMSRNDLDLILTDSRGSAIQDVKFIPTQNDTIEVHTGLLPPGIYILKLQSKDFQKAVKLIKF